MTDQQIFKALAQRIKKDIPGFKVCYKDESFVSRLLGILAWPFNRRYMKDFTTTRYPKVFFPNREFVIHNYSRAWKILAHEYVHLWDRKQEGPWFNLRYANPQVWAVLALSALSAIWVGPLGLLGLVALAFLAPWPSTGRRDIEIRGYVMSMAVDYWRYGNVRLNTKMWVVSQFTGWSYYKMWPHNDDMQDRIDKAVEDLADDRILVEGKEVSVMKWKHSETFPIVHALLMEAGYER